MKTKITIKYLMLALGMTLSITACKKNKSEPEPTPPVEIKQISITELRALSTGANIKVGDNRKIKGIVISDVTAKNLDSKTVIVQEANDKPGIIITFDAAQTFALNDELEINISNQTLAQSNGEIILQNVPAANAKKTGIGTITPKSANIADIVTNKATWNGTLVKIGTGSFTGGTGKYAGTLEFTDATSAKVKSIVLDGSTFKGEDYPSNIKSLTGIVRVNGSEVFLNIRKAGDVESAYAYTLTEDFQTLSTTDVSGQTSIDLAGYVLKGGIKWGPFVASSIPNNFTSDPKDAAFLETGKRYVYTSSQSAVLRPFLSNIEADEAEQVKRALGIKSVTIVSAGSMMDRTLTVSGVYDRTLAAFDPSKSGYNVQLRAKTSLKKISPVQRYYNQGVWNTVTFIIPSKSELMDTYFFSEEEADEFIAKPLFEVINAPQNAATRTEQQRGGAGFITPQIYSKLQFNYDTKPTWAP